MRGILRWVIEENVVYSLVNALLKLSTGSSTRLSIHKHTLPRDFSLALLRGVRTTQHLQMQ